MIPSIKIIRDNEVPYEPSKEELCNSFMVSRYCADLCDELQEHFVVLIVNARNQVLYRHNVHIGTVSTCHANPADILRAAILTPAARGIVLVHNHPSGNAQPSVEDNAITERIVCAASLLGFEVLDHVILTPQGGHWSYRDNGTMPKVPCGSREIVAKAEGTWKEK